jgi:hypothetical protein
MMLQSPIADFEATTPPCLAAIGMMTSRDAPDESDWAKLNEQAAAYLPDLHYAFSSRSDHLCQKPLHFSKLATAIRRRSIEISSCTTKRVTNTSGVRSAR